MDGHSRTGCPSPHPANLAPGSAPTIASAVSMTFTTGPRVAGHHASAADSAPRVATEFTPVTRMAGNRAERFSAVSARPLRTCAITIDGRLTCWGKDDSIRQIVARPQPPGSGKFQAVSARGTSSQGSPDACAIRADRALVCWGPPSA